MLQSSSPLPLPGDKALRLYVARVAGHASPIGVVARSGLGELSRALGPDVDVVDVEAVEVSRVVLPPAPPAPEPEMPARVFVLVTGSRVVGLASRLADLGHLIHEVDRAQFLRSGEKDADRYWWLAEKDENGFVITKLSVVEPIRSGLVGPAVATTVSASSPPARKPVEGELTREALLADADPKRRVRSLKYVRLHTPDSTGDTDEFRLVDPRRSGLSHAGLVSEEERGLVVSAGFVDVYLDEQKVNMPDTSWSHSLDVGPSIPDDVDDLCEWLWPTPGLGRDGAAHAATA